MNTFRLIFLRCATLAFPTAAARAELSLRMISENATPFIHEPFALRL
mgnify:CR=1 FL=1